MSNALKKITTEAKKIRKRHKAISWKSAIKQAGAKYRSGKIRTKKRVVKKKAVHKKRHKVSGISRNVDRQDRKKVNITIGTLKSQARKILDEKLGWYYINLSHAKTKTAKRQIARKINEVKKQLRQYAA